MTEKQPYCFVIMPFLPELNYFYLYLRDHVARVHGVRCERADAEVLTIPILDKITAMIRSADVVIADCTGRNPNVFYELGIAHTLEKKVVLITSDEIAQSPSDIRHFEFIKYNLNDSVSFLNRLDNALRNALVQRYDNLYVAATHLFREFRSSTNVRVSMASRDVFVQRVVNAEAFASIPSRADVFEFAEFILPKIVAEATEVELIRHITTYVASVGSTRKPDST